MSATIYGTGALSIGICQRCFKKIPYLMLTPDGDVPGLLVCSPSLREGCWDHKDPYKLPPRMPDPVALKHPRPDTPLNLTQNVICAEDYDLGMLIGPDGVVLLF